MRRKENPRNFSSSPHLPMKIRRRGIIPRSFPSPHSDWRPPIFISIILLRRKENPREFFPWREGAGLEADEEKRESEKFFLFSPFTY